MCKEVTISLCILLTAYGCKKVNSSDIKDDVPYYQHYSVIYNRTTNITEASASFNIRDANGSKVEIANGASIQANKTIPKTDFLYKTLYVWNFSGAPDVNFELVKNSGDKLNNSISSTDISQPEFTNTFPHSASKTAGFTFTWNGAPIDQNEFLDIRVSTPGPGSQAAKVLTDKNTTNTITFTSDDLKSVMPGKAIVQMIRNKEMPLSMPDGSASGVRNIQVIIEREIIIN